MTRVTRHILFLMVAIFLLLAMTSSVIADDKKTYYIDEPVFGGKAYIVEAGLANKQTVVLVHGLGDVASDTWSRLVPDLARHYRVLTFDLPGFGRSTKSNQLYSPDNYVAFINYLVRKSGIQQFMLVGHSMGANIALRYASTYPDRVNRLMLVDAAGVLHRITYSSYLTHFGIRLAPEFYPSQSTDVRSIAGMILGELARRNGIFEVGENMVLNDPALRQKILGGNPSTIAAYSMMMTDYTDSISSMKVPTLILWGADDNVTPIRTGRVLATNLPNSGLIVVSKAGHVLMKDQPLIFTNWLRRFVSESESGFQQLLVQKRYRIDKTSPINSKRIGSCRNSSGKTFHGEYELLTIDNCQDVTIDSARVRSLTIRDSQVVLNNCLVRSPGKAFLIENSDVQINGCTISGSPAISFKNSPLDIAGTSIVSTGTGLKNLDLPPENKVPRPGPLPGYIENDTTLIFSVSSLTSKYFDKKLHGPVNFMPEQAW